MAKAKISLDIFDEIHKLELTPEQEAIVLETQAAKYNFPMEIPNPNWKPNLSPENGNTPTIPNPASKSDFVSKKILEGILGDAKASESQRLSRVKEQEVKTEIDNAFKDAVVVEVAKGAAGGAAAVK